MFSCSLKRLLFFIAVFKLMSIDAETPGEYNTNLFKI